MSRIGMASSKPNENVLTTADKNLGWSSGFRTFKICKGVKFTSTGSKAHSLGYAPAFAIANPNLGILGMPYVYVDDTNVYCTSVSGGDVYVFLFIDPLDE